MKAQQGQVFAGAAGRYSLCCNETGRWYLKTLSMSPEEHILLEQHGPEDGLPWFPSVKYICAIASLKLGCRIRPAVDFSQADTLQQQTVVEAPKPIHRELPLSERDWTQAPAPAHQASFKSGRGWYDRHYPSGRR